MTPLPNPFEFNPAECPADTAVATAGPQLGAAAVTYTPEPFLEYARRRSMPIVSPPIKPQVTPAQPEWPRGFDPDSFVKAIEPVPIFLHKQYLPARTGAPLPIRALFDLAGPER